MTRTLAAVLIVLATALPAGAATASCGGLSPLQLTCTTELTPATSAIDVVVTTSVTFVGLIEVRMSQGDHLVTHPCPQVSIALNDCDGHVHGEFAPGARIDIEAEVFSIDGLTPSVGDWLVTVSG